MHPSDPFRRSLLDGKRTYLLDERPFRVHLVDESDLVLAKMKHQDGQDACDDDANGLDGNDDHADQAIVGGARRRGAAIGRVAHPAATKRWAPKEGREKS